MDTPVAQSAGRALLIVSVLTAVLIGLFCWLTLHFGASGPPVTATAVETALAELLPSLQQYDHGVATLVHALSSPDAGRRRASERILLDALPTWERLSPGEADTVLRTLAVCLARELSAQNARERAFSAQLAQRLLLRRSQGNQLDEETLAACEHVLRTDISVYPRLRLTDRGLVDSNDDEPLAAGAALHRWPIPDRQAVPSTAGQVDLPGGGLPIEAGSLLADDSARLETSDTTAGDPALADGAPSLPMDEPFARRRERTASRPDQEKSAAPTPLPARPLPLRQSNEHIRRLAASVPERQDNNDATVTLMLRLHDRDEQVAEGAAAELRRLGFGPVQLDLARQLTDSDPEVRRQLAEHLPRISGIDAEVWLVWLSRDSDPRVRLAAMTVMATTGDPNLLKHVARMAREDSDPRIQEQGERLSGAATTR